MEKNSVPYLVHEGSMARMDRIIKRLWVVIILLIVMLVATNGCWIWYNSQFETVEESTTTQSVEQDAKDGTNNFVGGDVNGETDSNDNN